MTENMYESFNNSLSRTIYQSPNGVGLKGEGSLIIQATSASGAIPIEGAEVEVRDNKGNPISRQYTDSSGRTAPVKLSAPDSGYSQNPGMVKPYETYIISVKKDGYYTEEFTNLQIFDDAVSIQPVNMKPLAEGAKPDDKIIIDEGSNTLWQ